VRLNSEASGVIQQFAQIGHGLHLNFKRPVMVH
jgi:hypothetical protein